MTIYFVRRNDDPRGYIKIGFSNNVGRRLKEMTTASPAGFELLGSCDGDINLERQFHLLLSIDRVSGEWFRPTADVFSLIQKASSGGFPCAEPSRVSRQICADDEFSQNIVAETRFYLNELVRREWLGLGDTIEEARDRVMTACGLDHSYGFRLWHKPKELKDVSGSAYRHLRLNYAESLEAEGRLNDNQASFLRLIRATADATFKGSAPVGASMDRPSKGASRQEMR